MTNAGGPITKRIPLPPCVAQIYRAIAELEKRYPNRKFTLDGHLLGSIGEVIAAEELGLQLHPMSQSGHDAYDSNGNIQIKITARQSVAMYDTCDRLVVLRLVSPEEAEIVYDGLGQPAWDKAGKPGKNGQRVISLSKLRKIALAGNEHDKWTWHVGDVEWERIPNPAAKPIIAPEDVELAKQLLHELETERSSRQKFVTDCADC